jgi:glucose/arabinose dehydrogenase
VLAPEYGGDGKKVGRCADAKGPIVAFPAHIAPNDLLFYTGNSFPEKYRNGALIAFHGSWNRSPLPQKGFFVAFVPFQDGKVAGDWEIFAEGFAGMETVPSPGDAKHRPTGLAIGPDGALYVADSVKGKIWKIVYQG